MVIIFKRVLKDFSLPMIYTSALLCVIYALPQLKLKGAAELCFAFLLPLFAVYFNLKSFKRGAAAGFSVFAADLIFFALSGIHFSIVFSAVAAVVTVYGFKNILRQILDKALFQPLKGDFRQGKKIPQTLDFPWVCG